VNRNSPRNITTFNPVHRP